ncbi:helix-turn-helix transcriptional regulator [Proteinivorax hydrogeniformans]|uniref:Helix-turn-helix transcriptional regulator n=1 Tax=Proteinivorax hydrogeniformans TaxID=1826727 RepID=A0AAU8HT09_9FIRM
MAFSEKIYELRKKSGLSQEQLAEQLSVSRQAISKWESGQSVPESEKLLAISNYFNVSLDFLMKEDNPAQDSLNAKKGGYHIQKGNRDKWMLGMITCIGGIVCLIIWGIISIFIPSTSNQMKESSMISIDGNGIFLIVCVIAIIVGAVLLLKNTSNK